jgi:hypothetical protein
LSPIDCFNIKRPTTVSKETYYRSTRGLRPIDCFNTNEADRFL